MKKVSICIPCYNEEDNLLQMYEVIKFELEKEEKYQFEIIFADNASADKSRDIIKDLAEKDKRVKGIINARNFGPKRSNSNAFYKSSGDCVITLACDFQDPPEMIHSLLRSWEKGNLVVFGQKVNAKEKKIVRFLRTTYYKIIQKASAIKHHEHVSSLFLMDRAVVDMIKKINDYDMDVHHLIEELGYHIDLVPYTQELRRAGKSSYNVFRYFDFAITELVYTSFLPLRIATIVGCIMAFISFIIGIGYLIAKLLFWSFFDAGMAPILIGIFFLGSVQLFFLGIIGEYIGVLLKKINNRPIVIEKELINF